MALGTTLPFWPALLFTYLEPISLIIGLYSAHTSPSDFVTRQTPPTPTLLPIHPGALILSYSIGNVFLVLAFVAILCTVITRDARVTKYYLFFIAIGDLGHIYASGKVLGTDGLMDVASWNDMMWGNVGVSAFLHVNRLATLLGAFGRGGR